MASIQTAFLKFWLRRLSLFNHENIDPLALRARIDRMAARARPQPGVQVRPVQVGNIPAEWSIPRGAPPDRAILYLHGGAWFMGSTKTHGAFVSWLAHAAGTRALAINYRLAPEDPFPAGLEDCLNAFEWLQQQGIPANKIIVAGDSAGGNLTLALLVALRDRGQPQPAGAVALSPATDLTGSGASQTTRKHLDPFFSHMGTSTIVIDYLGGHDPREPLISPLFADLHGLPPLLIHVGDHEILLDDAVRFGEAARAAGVDAKTVVWPGMFHVFHMFGALLPEARQANVQVTEFIRERLGGPVSRP